MEGYEPVQQDCENTNQIQPETTLKEWWSRWRESTKIALYEKEIRFRLMVMDRKQSSRLTKLSFRVLKEYMEYRRNKRSNKLQLYYLQERKLMVKGMKGFVMYFRKLGQFNRTLQTVYCKYLCSKYFGQMIRFKHISPKSLEFKIGLLQNRIQKRTLRQVFGEWNGIVEQSKSKRAVLNSVQSLLSKIEREQMANAFTVLKQQLVRTQKPNNFAPTQQNEPLESDNSEVSDQLFERRRKFTPIRQMRSGRAGAPRDQGNLRQRRSHQVDSPKKSEEHLSHPAKSLRAEKRSRLLNNLIALKETQIQWFQDRLFEGDPMYTRYTEKLRLQLGHYLQIASDKCL